MLYRIPKAIRFLEQYYNNYDEEGRLLSKHGQVEYRTTMTYIHKFLQKGMRILEVGAGTGRYSIALAREGYQVDAIELVQHNLDILNSNTAAADKITARQGNALDLSAFAEGTFDIVLVLGPMYHLYNEEDKRTAKRSNTGDKKGRKHFCCLLYERCYNDFLLLYEKSD